MTALNNLPQQLTSFVGREREIADIERLLGATRLLTLTGTGGCGKTRLALQVAEGLLGLDSYSDGVWFVELSTLTDPDLVPQTVASLLDVREETGRPLVDTLLDYLQPLNILLLLDNCEHLVGACASLVGTLLRSCPTLNVLVTSREALGIAGEVVWRIPSMSMPDIDGEELPHGGLVEYEAIRLFVERARLRRSDFAVTPENAPSVAQLCRQLDGIPLAIELAAARVKVLAVEQIVERLDERFKLLTSGDRQTLPRQQTLKALLDWSYDLLSQAEQNLLCSLSVFAGGFSLEAMQAVCAGEIDEYETIELLTRLVDKSLVVVDEHKGEARYHLLETIRRYAGEKLTKDEGRRTMDDNSLLSIVLRPSSASSDLRRRHRDWFLDLSEQAENELLGRQRGAWLDRMEIEHDNLRLALAWSRDVPGSIGEALRLAGSLVWFWYFRGYLSEGRGWIESILALPGAGMRAWPRAKALSAAGVLAYLQCDYAAARGRLEGGLGIWREAGEEHKRGVAFALSFLGLVAMRQGGPDARQLGEESVALFREIGDKWGLALALDFLGEVARANGDEERAWGLHKESLALYRGLDDKWGIALELSNFGRVALRQGRYEEARALLSESLAIQREVGDKWMVAWTLHNMGDVARCIADNERAVSLYNESLALFEKLGDKGGLASSLHMLGWVAQDQDDWKRAAALLEDSLALSRELGDKSIVAHVLYDLGKASKNAGDYWQTAALLMESLALMRELAANSELNERFAEAHPTSVQFSWLDMATPHGGNWDGATAFHSGGLALTEGLGDREVVIGCIEGLAEVAAAYGQPKRAESLFGAVEGLRGTRDRGLEVDTPRKMDRPPIPDPRSLIPSSKALDEDWDAGRTMTLDEAVVLALQELPSDARLVKPLKAMITGESAQATQPEAYPDDLTQREVEVLRLIAAGLPDIQLAEQLSVSTRTVQAHIRSIYTKLGVTNRSAATRYAFEHKLVM